MEENNKNKELNDEELNEVTGGSTLSPHYFNKQEDVKYIFDIGDKVYVKKSFFSSSVYCWVTWCEPFYDQQYNCYQDAYLVRGVDDSSYYTRALREHIVNQAD